MKSQSQVGPSASAAESPPRPPASTASLPSALETYQQADAKYDNKSWKTLPDIQCTTSA
jgi:hypothetical protein